MAEVPTLSHGFAGSTTGQVAANPGSTLTCRPRRKGPINKKNCNLNLPRLVNNAFSLCHACVVVLVGAVAARLRVKGVTKLIGVSCLVMKFGAGLDISIWRGSPLSSYLPDKCYGKDMESTSTNFSKCFPDASSSPVGYILMYETYVYIYI